MAFLSFLICASSLFLTAPRLSLIIGELGACSAHRFDVQVHEPPLLARRLDASCIMLPNCSRHAVLYAVFHPRYCVALFWQIKVGVQLLNDWYCLRGITCGLRATNEQLPSTLAMSGQGPLACASAPFNVIACI